MKLNIKKGDLLIVSNRLATVHSSGPKQTRLNFLKFRSMDRYDVDLAFYVEEGINVPTARVRSESYVVSEKHRERVIREYATHLQVETIRLRHIGLNAEAARLATIELMKSIQLEEERQEPICCGAPMTLTENESGTNQEWICESGCFKTIKVEPLDEAEHNFIETFEILVDALDCNLVELAQHLDLEIRRMYEARTDWRETWIQFMMSQLSQAWLHAAEKWPIRCCTHGHGAYAPTPSLIEDLTSPGENIFNEPLACDDCIDDRIHKRNILIVEFSEILDS